MLCNIYFTEIAQFEFWIKKEHLEIIWCTYFIYGLKSDTTMWNWKMYDFFNIAQLWGVTLRKQHCKQLIKSNNRILSAIISTRSLVPTIWGHTVFQFVYIIYCFVKKMVDFSLNVEEENLIFFNDVFGYQIFVAYLCICFMKSR